MDTKYLKNIVNVERSYFKKILYLFYREIISLNVEKIWSYIN